MGKEQLKLITFRPIFINKGERGRTGALVVPDKESVWQRSLAVVECTVRGRKGSDKDKSDKVIVITTQHILFSGLYHVTVGVRERTVVVFSLFEVFHS